MNSFVCVFVCLAVAVCAVHAEDVVPTDDVVASYAEAFQKYLVKFNKHYDSQEEYNKRLRAYATSMENVKIWNQEFAGQTTFGETPRSDFFEEEKKSLGVTIPASQLGTRAINQNSFPQPKKAVELGHKADNVPTEFNWFNVSGVWHPAKNQGSCGSCWAFSAIGQLEMQAILEGHEYVNLSEQQACDCAHGSISRGCCGGYPGDLYEDVQKYVPESDYKYELANAGSSNCNPYSCRSDGKPIVPFTIRGYDQFTPFTASELKKQIWMYGPISIWMNAPSFLSSYTGGIVKCTSTASGAHYVLAVGWGSNYIMIRNSWGANWGLNGDFMLSTDSDLASCQLLQDRGYIQLARVSVEPHEDVSGQSQPLSSNSAMRALPLLTFVLLIVLLL